MIARRVWVGLAALVLLAASCAHNPATRRRQKVAVASTIAVVVIVVGLAVLVGSATDCEDTGNCDTPQPLDRLGRPPDPLNDPGQ